MKALQKNTLLIVLSLLLLVGCKKDKKTTPAPSTTTSNLSGYYIKGTVNGTTVNTVDGQNSYTVSDGNQSGSDGSNGINVTYTCSFQQESSSNDKYYQLSFANKDVTDGDDSDEMQTYFTTGVDSLSYGNSPNYTLSYTDENGVFYTSNPSAAKIALHITNVTDLGKQNISNENKRVVKLTGTIASARLYEYNFGVGYTTNYVDITNLAFVIRFTSVVNMQ